MCKERNVKGYSKLTKDDLIQAILSKACEPSPGNITEDPATQKILQRTSTKKVYSREESEKRIQENPAVLQKRAEIAGFSPEKVKETGTTNLVERPASKKSGGSKKKLTDAEVQPREVKAPSSKKAKSKRTKPATGKIIETPQSAGAPAKRLEAKPSPAKPAISRKKPSGQLPKEPAKTTPSQPAAQEEKEPRLQDQPASDQAIALKKISKNIMPILRAHKQDFMRRNTKDLEKMLGILEIEKNRFTVYQRTDKMLRNFIDESIKLINDAKEEQFNKMEQEYCVKVLPGILKKNENDVKKIVSQIGPYFSETDAAKQIVEKIVKKSPFPRPYLITVILKKIRDKSLAGDRI